MSMCRVCKRDNLTRCSECGRRIQTYTTKGTIVVHKPWTGFLTCPGSKRPPQSGHPDCEYPMSCTCQHRPRGSWRGE